MAAKSKSESQGFLGKVEINSAPWGFASCGLKSEYNYIGFGNESGASGSIDPTANLYTCVKQDVKGDISGPATYAVAKVLTRAFFCGAGDTLPTDPADNTVNTVDVRVNRILGTNAARKYLDCWCNSLKITGKDAAALEWAISLLGKTDAADSGGAIAAETAASYVRNSDVTFTINSNTYYPVGWELELNHNLEDADESFRQSLTRNTTIAGERIIKGKLTMPWNTDTTADLMAYLHDKTFAHGLTIGMTDGTNIINIAMTQVLLRGTDPDLANSGKVQPEIEFQAVKTSGAALATVSIT